MLEDYDTVIRTSLRILELPRISPEKFEAKYHVFYAAAVLLPALTHILSFIYDEPTFENVTDWVVKVFVFVNIFLKYTTLAVKRADIKQFIDVIRVKFWPIDSVKFSENFVLETSMILRNLRWLILCCEMYIVTCVGVMVFAGMGLGFRGMISHVPSFLTEDIGNFVDIVICVINASVLLGFNFVFATFVVLLRVQFVVLNEHFLMADLAAVDERKRIDVVRRLVDHHNFLLSQSKKLKDIFGNTLLIFIWNEVLLNCFCLYVFVVSTNFVLRVKQLFMVGCFTAELLVCFFLPCHLLSEEAASLSDSIFASDWIDWSELSSAKVMLNIIQKSQKGITVTAGNFIPMNLETCKTIYKSTFSMYTFLRHIKLGRH